MKTDFSPQHTSFRKMLIKALRLMTSERKCALLHINLAAHLRKFRFEVTELSLQELKQVDMLEDGIPIEHSTESDNNEEISTLQLRLTMNDQEASTITITFLQFDVPVRKSTAEYLIERENLEEIYHQINSMMKSVY